MFHCTYDLWIIERVFHTFHMNIATLPSVKDFIHVVTRHSVRTIKIPYDAVATRAMVVPHLFDVREPDARVSTHDAEGRLTMRNILRKGHVRDHVTNTPGVRAVALDEPDILTVLIFP